MKPVWATKPIREDGKAKVAVVLADGERVILNAATAKAFACALIHAAIEAKTMEPAE
jgi:hypothetical protein